MNQPSLPFAKESETSKAAADSMREAAPILREKILAALKRQPRTCDQIEADLGLKHQTASARIFELARDGKIKVAGRAKTRSGRMADVWGAA